MTNLTFSNKDGLEIIVDRFTGEAFCSQAAYCRMSGANKSTISMRMKGVQSSEIKPFKVPTAGGFQELKGVQIKTCLQLLTEDNPNVIPKLIDFVYEKTGKKYDFPIINKIKKKKYKYTEKKFK